jgi:large subunit ribosomal protein L6
MSTRIARNPIEIPKGVDVKLEGQALTVKGPKGELSRVNHDLVSVVLADEKLQFSPANESKESNALTGTSCALAKNMVQGVSVGFERKLLMVGVGYRAKAQGNKLDISAGFSHPVVLEMPEGITVETPTQTEIVLKGADKQRVTQAAANIRAVRPPEPYKGKGIRYSDEIIILKEAKKK